MKRIRESIAFCMVLLLLLGLAGCAEPTPSSSVPPSSSSEQSSLSELEPEIEPYVITPLDTPMNGGMTYEEYFSIERGEKECECLYMQIHHLGAKENAYKTDAFWEKDGCVWYNDHELYWMTEDEAEIVLLYRTPKLLRLRTTTESLIIWQEFTPGLTDDYVSLHRFYIPTLQHDSLMVLENYTEDIRADYRFEVTEYYNTKTLSSTDFRGARYFHQGGRYEVFVFSSLTNKAYPITTTDFDANNYRNSYEEQRNKDVEEIKFQKG